MHVCSIFLSEKANLLKATLCDNVHVTGLWFSPGTPVSSTNKTDLYDITEILLKVALSTITHNP